MVLSKTRITKALIRLRGCAGWSAPVLFANPRRQVFSRRGPILTCHKQDISGHSPIVLTVLRILVLGIGKDKEALPNVTYFKK